MGGRGSGRKKGATRNIKAKSHPRVKVNYNSPHFKAMREAQKKRGEI